MGHVHLYDAPRQKRPHDIFKTNLSLEYLSHETYLIVFHQSQWLKNVVRYSIVRRRSNRYKWAMKRRLATVDNDDDFFQVHTGNFFGEVKKI